MRRALGLLAVGVLFLQAGRARADDRDAALAVVDQAVKAHGGEGPLGKLRCVHRVGKGGWFLFGKENSFSVETVLQLPDRFRDTAEVEVGGQKNRMTTVLNGDRGWQLVGAGSLDLDKEKIAEFRDIAYDQWLMTLLPLKDRSLALATVPQANVLGKAAAAIKVTAANRPEVLLFFDKQSGLLVKVERAGKQAGISVKKEYFLADYKDFEGVKLPTRWLEMTSGNKSIDLTITAYDFPARIDERLLEKP